MFLIFNFVCHYLSFLKLVHILEFIEADLYPLFITLGKHKMQTSSLIFSYKIEVTYQVTTVTTYKDALIFTYGQTNLKKSRNKVSTIQKLFGWVSSSCCNRYGYWGQSFAQVLFLSSYSFANNANQELKLIHNGEERRKRSNKAVRW